MDAQAREAEQAHLDRALSTFAALVEALSQPAGARGGGDEFAKQALDRMRRERLRAYSQASGPLYFGRIDDVEGRTLYVGRHAVLDKDSQALVINWRAPAAERFYTARPGRPHGVALRRRLDIQGNRVTALVDERMAPDGEDHLVDTIAADINRQRLGEMRQIISTITPEQYGLIADDHTGALVVQGGPGTGKTAVGLHRAAWLLYVHQDVARAGVLVIGPNPTFMRYISGVLPSLGEQGVEHRSIERLISERPPSATDPTRLAKLKGSGRMAVVLEKLARGRIVVAAGSVSVSVARVTVSLTAEELTDVVNWACDGGRSYQNARGRFRERLPGVIASRAMGVSRSLANEPHDAVAALVRATKEYQQLATKVWPRETPDTLLKRLFTNASRLRTAADGVLSDEEISALVGSRRSVASDDMTHADLVLLDEARWLIDRDGRTFGHVVIDEAQNLTPMELRMAVRRARQASLTILGDIAQRTAATGISTWAHVLAEAGVRQHDVRSLLVSYRVPGDYLRVAATVVDDPESVPRGVRTAPWPAVAVRTRESELGSLVARLAERIAAVAGSVGVVAPTGLIGQVGDALVDVPFTNARHAELGPGVNLCDLAVIKGLEFDAVIVVEPVEILRDQSDGGRGGLYTALTRSTRALIIIHSEDLPAGLGGAPDLRHLRAGPRVQDEWQALEREIDLAA